MKKVSQAALDGLAKVSGQMRGRMYNRDNDCACFEGCVAIGYGVPKDKLHNKCALNFLKPKQEAALDAADKALVGSLGAPAMKLNDEDGLSVEDIAGILRAEGH